MRGITNATPSGGASKALALVVARFTGSTWRSRSVAAWRRTVGLGAGWPAAIERRRWRSDRTTVQRGVHGFTVERRVCRRGAEVL